uniref:Uncharacterized protein n=1 Tax=Panagrolaimus superbus TaxID=310955 RepID=A0A914YEJ3_9BILA
MADNVEFCYHCISAGIMESIKKQIKRFPESISFLQTVSWVMGQMSHLRDSPSFKETAWDLFPALKTIPLKTFLFLQVIKDVAPHLTSPILELQTACLHFFGNCVSGTDEITQQIINCGVLKHLHKFLNHLNLNLQEETAWMLSNILAGTKDQITAVFAADLMPSIIGLTESDEISVTEKAVWAIANVPLCGTLQHINLLLDLNIIPSLCKLLLLCPKKEIIQSVLEAINGIQRQSCDRREEIRQKMLAAGVIDHLRQLCNHESDAIESNAMQLLNDLFNDSI